MGMGSQGARGWLVERRKVWLGSTWLQGALLSLAGALTVLATYGVIYAVFWFPLFSFTGGIRAPWIHAVAGTALFLLFLGNSRKDREYLESWSFSSGTHDGKVQVILVPGLGLASTMNPLAPDSMHSMLKMLVSVLFTGPRLCTAALRAFRKSRRLQSMDVNGCATVLERLHAKGTRVSCTELTRDLPAVLIPQLRDVDGVIFLTSEPRGLALTSALREELSTQL